jgi:hypothetical protein
MTVEKLPRRVFHYNHLPAFDFGGITVTTGEYESGVAKLVVESDRVRLEILPYQGQQIWNAQIDGRDITMKSVVDRPVVTQDYLRNYGAFLVHCGATAMGGPSEEDTHPLHGELPNATYNETWIETGEDIGGNQFVEIHGKYFHQVAMTVSYLAHPVVRVTQGSSVVEVSMEIENRMSIPMELMYLAHMNFLPIDDSTIEGTHQWDNASIRVRDGFPSHVHPTKEFLEFLARVVEDPSQSQTLEKGRAFDPEAVMMVDYQADENGWAHSLQVHPSGTSDYVRHQPANAPVGVRCIQRTPLHDCIGMVLPATAEVDGLIAERKKGNVIMLEGGKSYKLSYSFGTLDNQQTTDMREHIASVMSR